MKEFWIAGDLGYGQVKGVNEENKKFIFPSILAPGKDRSLDKFFNNLQNDIINNLHVRISESSSLTGKDYFVGKLAQKRNINSYFNTRDNKIYSDENKVFLATLSGLLLPKNIANEEYSINIITGLPVSHFVKQKHDFEAMLKSLNMVVEFPDHDIKHKISFNKVLLMPQGAGALNYILLSNGQKYLMKNTYIGLIDIGFKTTDIVVFKIDSDGQLDFISDMSSTLENVGMSNIFTEIEKIFIKSSQNGESLSVDRLMELGQNGQIFYNGSYLDLTDELRKLKTDLAASIVNNIDTLWTSSAKSAFNSVILAGGGGMALYPYLKSKLGVYAVDLAPNSEFANAYGYLNQIKR